MKFRFEPNEIVMYGAQGACTLVEISEKDFGGDAKMYYVLRPAFSGSSVFYVPVDNEVLTAKMHSLKNAGELRMLVSGESSAWIEEDRARQNYLKQVIDGGGTEILASVYKLLRTKQKELVEIGKKLRAADERSMQDIEKLLFEEMSFSFELEKEDVEPFLFGEKELLAK